MWNPEQSSGSQSSENRGIPDLRWINQHVSVAEIARALDLRLDGASKIHCWQGDKHKNGDRTASVGIRHANNTVKCFGCDSKPMGPVDLVMSVLRLNGPADAALWIAARFRVPCIPKGKHLKQAASPPVRAGFEGDLGVLIFSGMWARLSLPARAIVPVLLNYADRQSGAVPVEVRLSYRAISRYSGISSPNAIAEAIRELEEIGWMARKEGSSSLGHPVRTVGVYVLTPQAAPVVERASALWQENREAIEIEREIRQRQRTERQRQRQRLNLSAPPAAGPRGDVCTQYKPLYSLNSDGEIAAILRIAGNRRTLRELAQHPEPTFRGTRADQSWHSKIHCERRPLSPSVHLLSYIRMWGLGGKCANRLRSTGVLRTKPCRRPRIPAEKACMMERYAKIRHSSPPCHGNSGLRPKSSA